MKAFALFLFVAALLQAAPPRTSPGALPDGLVGPPISHGLTVFTTPRISDVARERTKAVRPGAVLVEQEAQVEATRFVTDRRIVTGAPFDADLPAGSAFTLLRAGDELRRCLERVPYTAFSPLQDENGDIFSGICLVDADGDGGFEALQLRPYLRDRLSNREVPIRPVHLLAAEQRPDPRLFRFVAVRRIRVAEVTGHDAAFVLETAAGEGTRIGAFRDRGSEDRLVLSLRPGTSGVLGGVTLRVGGTRGAWVVRAEGSLEPWASLRDQGTTFVAGPFQLRDE